jgi:hypothetical protein
MPLGFASQVVTVVADARAIMGAKALLSGLSLPIVPSAELALVASVSLQRPRHARVAHL